MGKQQNSKNRNLQSPPSSNDPSSSSSSNSSSSTNTNPASSSELLILPLPSLSLQLLFSAPAITLLLSFAITFQLYLKTLSPSIAGGDSGELVAEGCQLGTAHPPGYPLFTTVVYVLVRLNGLLTSSFGTAYTPAYVTNVFSAIAGACASTFVAGVVLVITLEPSNKNHSKNSISTTTPCVAALTAALLCSMSPLNWLYSVTSEVFSLNNFFTTLTLLLTVLFSVYRESSRPSLLLPFGALVCGLSLTNQHTSILLSVPAVLYLIFRGRLLYPSNLRLLLTCASCTLAALSLYLLLPFYATAWGHRGSWGDVTNAKGLFRHVTRGDYGTFQLYSGSAASTEGFAARTESWIRDFTEMQGSWQGVVALAGWGVFAKLLLKPNNASQQALFSSRAREAVLLLVVLLAFYLGVFHSLANLPLTNKLLYGVHQRFWMQPNFVLFIFAGLGMDDVVSRAANLLPAAAAIPAKATKHSSSTAPALARVALHVVFSCVLLLHALRRHYALQDQSSNEIFRNYARAVLDSLPQNSLLLINYDQQWTSVRYLQECEAYRTDVISLNLSMMNFPWWHTKRSLYAGDADDATTTTTTTTTASKKKKTSKRNSIKKNVVVWPGTHYVAPYSANRFPKALPDGTTPEGGFSFDDFVVANVESFEGGVYMGGKSLFQETEYKNVLETLPWGLLTRFVKKTDMRFAGEDGLFNYFEESKSLLRMVSDRIGRTPPEDKYGEDTWEWTTKRELFDHVMERASNILAGAVELIDEKMPRSDSPRDLMPIIIEAAATCEVLLKLDEQTKADYATWKNLGLAYLKIITDKTVRSKSPREFIEDARGVVEIDGVDMIDHIAEMWAPAFVRSPEETHTGEMGAAEQWSRWKTLATENWSRCWGKFLSIPNSNADSSYQAILQVYTKVMGVAKEAKQ